MVSGSPRTTPLIIYIHLEGSLHLAEPQSLSERWDSTWKHKSNISGCLLGSPQERLQGTC